ncbi:MAG: lipoyl(octanoyl) transferase LipB [Thermoleophilaceae bacterium]
MPDAAVPPDLWVASLGVVGYTEALDLQERVRAARQGGLIPDTLLLLEHPPVFTKGPRTQSQELPMGEDWYRMQGIEISDTDRGGHLTYHGPGQLVAYPIVEVRDVPGYVATLERAMVAALAEEGVTAVPRDGFPGAWVGDDKIGSIGLHISRGVSKHGLAINVDNDLQPFEYVVPCGLDGVRMTSLLRETGRTGAMPCFRKRVGFQLAKGLGRRQRLVSRDRLERALAGGGAPLASLAG